MSEHIDGPDYWHTVEVCWREEIGGDDRQVTMKSRLTDDETRDLLAMARDRASDVLAFPHRRAAGERAAGMIIIGKRRLVSCIASLQTEADYVDAERAAQQPRFTGIARGRQRIFEEKKAAEVEASRHAQKALRTSSEQDAGSVDPTLGFSK